MALLDNGAQINTIMLRYVNDHSLQVGLITNLIRPPKSPVWGWVMPMQDH